MEFRRTQQSDQAINNFNDLARKVYFLVSDRQITPRSWSPLSQDTINSLYQPLQPPITHLQINYPTGDYSIDLPYQSVQYTLPNGIRPLDIYGAISTFYHRQLDPSEIGKYLTELPELEQAYQQGLPLILADTFTKYSSRVDGLEVPAGLNDLGYDLDLGKE